MGVHLEVSIFFLFFFFAAASHPWPALVHPSIRLVMTDSEEEGVEVLACCHMRESAYIQCLWVRTGKYRRRKKTGLSFGGFGCLKPLLKSSLFRFSALRRHSLPRSQLWMTGEGKLMRMRRRMGLVGGGSSWCGVLKIHHQLTREHGKPSAVRARRDMCMHVRVT